MRNAFVYIMSNRSHRLYVGSTVDLLTRVKQHKTKAYPNGFTARYNFDRLVWCEVTPDEGTARKREKAIKKWPRAKKVVAIQEKSPTWLGLSPRPDWPASLVQLVPV